MPAAFYTHAAYLVATKQLDLVSDPLKVLLLGVSGGGYAFDPAHEFVDPGGAGPTSVAANELAASGYAGGFGGAGRKAAARTAAEDASARRVRILFSNLTWTDLGGAANDTVVGAVLVAERTTDADSLLVAYWPLPPTLTAGRDFVLVADSVNGNLQLLA